MPTWLVQCHASQPFLWCVLPDVVLCFAVLCRAVLCASVCQIRCCWYKLCIAAKDESIYPQVVDMLSSQGRMKVRRGGGLDGWVVRGGGQPSIVTLSNCMQQPECLTFRGRRVGGGDSEHSEKQQILTCS